MDITYRADKGNLYALIETDTNIAHIHKANGDDDQTEIWSRLMAMMQHSESANHTVIDVVAFPQWIEVSTH